MQKIVAAVKPEDVQVLKEHVSAGSSSARKIRRANVLLMTAKGMTTTQIAEDLSVNRHTVAQVKRKYVEGGLENALNEKPRPGQPVKYGEKERALIIAKACSSPPEGRVRWSLELLSKELTKDTGIKFNDESIRLILKKAKPSPG